MGDDLQEMSEHMEAATEGMSKGGFPLKGQWTTNFPANDEEGLFKQEKELMLLGLQYNSEEDSLAIKVKFNLSKRNQGEKGVDGLITDKESVIREVN